MKTTDSSIHLLYNEWPEYELLDAGNGKKLERFGDYIIIRSEPKAWWDPDLKEAEWKKAVAICDTEKKWVFKKPVSHEWYLRFDTLTLKAQFTDMSKHVGVFPEQSPHWQWIKSKIQDGKKRPCQLLTLFGYTGIASLLAASHGATVTQVDASKPAITWAKHNQQLSNLSRAPIRWILDDAVKFVKREIRRGKRYDALILDPPSFGRGPKKEVWKIEKHLKDLLLNCRQLMGDKPLFVIITLYSLEASSLMVGNVLGDVMRGYQGVIQQGELVLKQKYSDKKLPLSIFARWEPC